MSEFTEARAVEDGLDDATIEGASAESVTDTVAAAADSIREVTKDSVDEVLAALAQAIRESPLVAVGIAAGVAYFVGRLRS